MIVLETFGRHQQTVAVRIKLFLTKKSAEKYCQESTDTHTSDGFWQYAELIDEDTMYELKKSKNISYANKANQKSRR